MAAITLCAVQTAQAMGATATDEEQKRVAMKHLAHEMSMCTAYFTLAATVLKRAAPDDERSIVRRYTAAGKTVLEQATEIARALGLEDNTVDDWSRLALQEMVKEINADPKKTVWR